MSLRRATATALISIGVAAALSAGCAGTDTGTSGTRVTGTGNGNGSGGETGGAGGSSSGAGGGNSGGSVGTGGSGPPPINPGNPEAGSDVRVQPDAACGVASTKGEKKPTDLYLMMDTSGSMLQMDTGQTGSRWDNLAMAMPGFVNDMANAGMMIGLDFFPEGDGNNVCNVADYQAPNVPIAVLPGNAMAITTAITGRTPVGGTPTGPALTGAIQTARAWQQQNLDRSINVLLLTDGIPQGCGVNNANPTGPAVMAAQAGTMGMPPIKTYVLGVGPNTGNLDAIAAAGGTMKAYMVTGGGAADLTKALAEIRKSTLSCDYNIPKSDGGATDLTKVVVQVKEGMNGMLVDIPNVVNAQGCAGNPQNQMGIGWYYDNPPPGVPTKITLCPNSCGPLQVADGSEVGILLGCVPKVIPPPAVP